METDLSIGLGVSTSAFLFSRVGVISVIWLVLK